MQGWNNMGCRNDTHEKKMDHIGEWKNDIHVNSKPTETRQKCRLATSHMTLALQRIVWFERARANACQKTEKELKQSKLKIHCKPIYMKTKTKRKQHMSTSSKIQNIQVNHAWTQQSQAKISKRGKHWGTEHTVKQTKTVEKRI